MAPDLKHPTAEDLAKVTADTRLAAYIVGVLVLRGILRFEFDPTDYDEMQTIILTITDVSQAIRDGLPHLDITELRWLNMAPAFESGSD